MICSATEIGMDPPMSSHRTVAGRPFPLPRRPGPPTTARVWSLAPCSLLRLRRARSEQKLRRDPDRTALGMFCLRTSSHLRVGGRAGVRRSTSAGMDPRSSTPVRRHTGKARDSFREPGPPTSCGIPVEMISFVHGDTDSRRAVAGTAGRGRLQARWRWRCTRRIEAVEKPASSPPTLFNRRPGDISLDKDRGGFHVSGPPDEFRSWRGRNERPRRARSHRGTTDFRARRDVRPRSVHTSVVRRGRPRQGQGTLLRMVTFDDARPSSTPSASKATTGASFSAAQAFVRRGALRTVRNPNDQLRPTRGFSVAAGAAHSIVDMAHPSPMNPLVRQVLG